MASRMIDSPLGKMRLEAGDFGVRVCAWVGDARLDADVPCVEGTRARGSELAEGHLDQLERELAEYFAGERSEFEVAIDQPGTPFQRKVWSMLREIPFGETWSYEKLAKRSGLDAGACRAVGAANGRNLVCIVVPCHRVIAKDGTLCGFAGGLERKRWLLEHEAKTPVDGLFAGASFTRVSK